ncbi:MAG: SpoIIE family protein phosphatase [Phycisphaerae bacterium]|nr:SpoIIE family protein phosphatase [Phycisphaerae bacterium]
MFSDRGITFKLVSCVLISCAAILVMIVRHNYRTSRRMLVGEIETSAQNLSMATANRIEAVIRPVEKVPETLADLLAQCGELTESRVKRFLRDVVASNPDIYGATVAFEPNEIPGKSLFAPYYYRGGDGIKFTSLEASYHYPDWDWYKRPKALNRSVWSEPYYDDGGGNVIMSTYSVPFYRGAGGERRLVGVVTADLSLTWLQEIVAGIHIARTGYGFLISKKGTIVTHPDKQRIMTQTVFEMARQADNERLREIAEEMTKGHAGFASTASLVTGQECWLAYAPLKSTGWSLGVLFPQEELMAPVRELHRTVLIYGGVGLALLSVVVVVISGTITRPIRSLSRAAAEIATGNLDLELPTTRGRDEVGQLTGAFVHMRDSLRQYIADLTATTAAKQRIESELSIARDIQMSMLPKSDQAFDGRTSFEIGAVLEPAKEVGGDLYDFFFIDDDHLCMVIGDVSGKGVPAALFMAATKTLIKTNAHGGAGPDEVFGRVNAELSVGNDSSMFCTAWMGILDVRTGELVLANAGHNPPLLIGAGGEARFIETSSGIALAAFEKAVYPRHTMTLAPGDTILLYTDGVTEALSDRDELFSDRRLAEGVGALSWRSPKELIGGILDEVRRFSRGVPQSDDITMLAVTFRGGG